MKIEQDVVIQEHKVSQLGTPEVSESIDLPLYPKGYEKPAATIAGYFSVRGQGDVVFHAGQKIRVTIETID